LSVNWLEFLKLRSREEEISEIRRLLESKLTIAAFGRIAILNVGNTRRHVLNNTPDRRILTVLHEPEKNDPSHSGIYGLKPDDMFIGELIAEQIEEVYPAREPKPPNAVI
jgi:hypothetical protein